ncbi:MAG TPA: metallophosphoesterase [Anaerolineae bacterium]|nr:metallophosphoesterase [Anaerolineae bacterium]
MKILTVSDKVDPLLYSPALRRLYGDVDLVLGCGDLPHYYLEYIVTMLGGPLFYVIGNHTLELKPTEQPPQRVPLAPGHANREAHSEPRDGPDGCENIHGRHVRYRGLLLAGLEGSMRYSTRPDYQYTEPEMAAQARRLLPGLLWNRIRHGRYLDILVTHAPPAGIHDLPDLCHSGFRIFRTLMERFHPRYLVHGHVHLYGTAEVAETTYRQTQVINSYGYRLIQMDNGTLRHPKGLRW